MTKISEYPAQNIQADLEESARLLALGDYGPAVTQLTAALFKDPDDGAAQRQIFQAAKLMASSKKVSKRTKSLKKPEAEAEAETAAAADADSAKAEAHYQKGLIYYSLRNYREAFNEFKLAVSHDPNSRKLAQALKRVQSDLKTEEEKPE